MPRPKGSPNKLTSEIKERLSQVIMDAMATIDIDSMTQNERLKLIQIGLQYVVPRLKHTEEINETPTNFQIEIIDKTSDVDK
jgi:ATP-dependent Lon protease